MANVDCAYSLLLEGQGTYGKERTEKLLQAIKYAGGTETPKQRYIIAFAYACLGSKYRKQAVQHLELYVNNTLWEECYNRGQTIESHIYARNDRETNMIQKNSHLSKMYDYLGQAYEGECEFEKALKIYAQALKLEDYFAYKYLRLTNVLRKMNRLAFEFTVPILIVEHSIPSATLFVFVCRHKQHSPYD